ncbi:SAICAR synthase-like protein [Wilcoxina mikolae CBS 423.85]|nr:SAICAR synthase-like protein [Wilcoxina mikolae CBS 423.85]
MLNSAKLKASNLKAFDLAAAGHEGVLSDESGSVVVKPCTAREVSFYETSLLHPSFAVWMPAFFGTLTLSDEIESTARHGKPSDREFSLVLQNLCYGFKKPCVLDIKLGAQLWDEHAPQDKRDRLDTISDNTTSRALGFRVAGMKVWKKEGNTNGYKVYDKHYGRVFTADNVIDALQEYFASDITPKQAKLIAGRFLAKVRAIKEVLESQESRMYSASFLFVYEGDGKVLDQALEDEKTRYQDEGENSGDEFDEKTNMVEELKLIDFAHASWTPGQGPDENALQGVRSIENLMAKIAV